MAWSNILIKALVHKVSLVTSIFQCATNNQRALLKKSEEDVLDIDCSLGGALQNLAQQPKN